MPLWQKQFRNCPVYLARRKKIDLHLLWTGITRRCALWSMATMPSFVCPAAGINLSSLALAASVAWNRDGSQLLKQVSWLLPWQYTANIKTRQQSLIGFH